MLICFAILNTRTEHRCAISYHICRTMFFASKKKRKKAGRKFLSVFSCFLLGVAGTVVGTALFITRSYLAFANAPVEVEVDPNLGIKSYVVEFFTDNDAKEMLPIIACESEFKHFNTDGSVLRNREGSSAVGVAQILTSKHPDPKALQKYNRLHNTTLTPDDFDVRTLQGNLGYALLLYEIRGTRDWECAKKIR